MPEPRHRAKRESVSSIVDGAGKRHRYLNQAVPRDHQTDLPVSPLPDAICRRCGHGYSDLMRRAAADLDPLRTASLCTECQGDDMAERGLWLQRELGINLGWSSRDPVTERIVHGFKERPIPMGNWDLRV